MSFRLADLPYELVSDIAECMPHDDLKNFRLVCTNVNDAAEATFARRVTHLTMTPEQSSMVEVAKWIGDNRVRNVSKLTLDFTNGVEAGLSLSNFATSVVESVTGKITHPFQLELLHRDPAAAREATASNAQLGFLKLLGPAISANQRTRQNLQILTFNGFSCKVGIMAIVTPVGAVLKSLTLQTLTFSGDQFRILVNRLPEALPVLQNLRIYDVQCSRKVNNAPRMHPVLRPPGPMWHLLEREYVSTGNRRPVYDVNDRELGYWRVNMHENEAEITCGEAMVWIFNRLKGHYGGPLH